MTPKHNGEAFSSSHSPNLVLLSHLINKAARNKAAYSVGLGSPVRSSVIRRLDFPFSLQTCFKSFSPSDLRLKLLRLHNSLGLERTHLIDPGVEGKMFNSSRCYATGCLSVLFYVRCKCESNILSLSLPGASSQPKSWLFYDS